MIQAAHNYRVPANVLLAIASNEMGANGDHLENTNRSLDLGHFGINTIHFTPGEPLARAGIRPEHVASNGCYNAQVAAWLLATHLHRKRGEDFWVWAANYHSATPRFNEAYRTKLKRHAHQWAAWLRHAYPHATIYPSFSGQQR